MAVLPTWRLLGLALVIPALLGLGALAATVLLAAPMYALALAALVWSDLRRTPGRGDLEVERRHERRLSLGEANPVEVVVRWVGRAVAARPARLWARDETPAGIPTDAEVMDGAIEPGGEWRGTYHLRPHRRGDYRFGDLNLRIESPMRLVRRQIVVPLAEAVHVYPNLRAIRRYELQVRRGREVEAGLRRTRLLGRGTEFERLRDYRPDDEYRRIAWKATARRRSPVVIEHEIERSQNVLLLIDAGRLMAAPIGEMQKIDYAVNAAAVMAYVATRLGDRVGAMVFADRVEQYLPPARGRAQFQVVLDGLRRATALPVESSPSRALLLLGQRNPRRSLVVLFADIAEASDAASLVIGLGAIARHHLTMCVMTSDPALLEMARHEPTDSRRAYERVVAQRLLDERRTVVERLERLGAIVVDVPADRLTAETVDQYLSIKATTRL